jgi:hypothetical protein
MKALSRRHFAIAVGACFSAASAVSCSMLLSTGNQCNTTGDCLARGAEFRQTQCSEAKVCVTDVQDASDGASRQDGGAEDPFACGTLPPQSEDFTKSVAVTMHYIDTSGPATLIDARLCAAKDPLCTNARPLRATDAGRDASGSGLDGGAGERWVAPGNDGVLLATVEKGFEGFFEVRTKEYAPALRFTSPPLRNSTNNFEQTLLRPFEISTLASLVGRNYDASTRGLVFVFARDCNQQPLANMRFTTSTEDPTQFGFYIVNSTPSITDGKTDGTGRGGFANMKEGLHTFTAEFADTGKRLGSARALVRVGTNTTISILPSL